VVWTEGEWRGCWRQLISVWRVGADTEKCVLPGLGSIQIFRNIHTQELDFYMGSMYERSRFSGFLALLECHLWIVRRPTDF